MGWRPDELGRPSSSGRQPMPTSWVHPNKSPLGFRSRSAGVIGSDPFGPGAAVTTSRSAGSSPSKIGCTRNYPPSIEDRATASADPPIHAGTGTCVHQDPVPGGPL